MPGAKLALVVSGKVVDGAQTLAQAAAGKPVVTKAVRKAGARVQRAAAPVVRKAKASVAPTVKASVKRATKAVSKSAAKVVKAVDVEVAKAPRRVRAAKKAVAQALAA